MLSQQDFEALQHSAASRAFRPVSLIKHLLAMPRESVERTQAPAHEQALTESGAAFVPLDLQPREIDFS